MKKRKWCILGFVYWPKDSFLAAWWVLKTTISFSCSSFIALFILRRQNANFSVKYRYVWLWLAENVVVIIVNSKLRIMSQLIQKWKAIHNQFDAMQREAQSFLLTWHCHCMTIRQCCSMLLNKCYLCWCFQFSSYSDDFWTFLVLVVTWREPELVEVWCLCGTKTPCKNCWF